MLEMTMNFLTHVGLIAVLLFALHSILKGGEKSDRGYL